MRCNTLQHFQQELESATHALRSVKSSTGIPEFSILIMRRELAHAALVKHRSTCLTCVNERRKATLRGLDR